MVEFANKPINFNELARIIKMHHYRGENFQRPIRERASGSLHNYVEKLNDSSEKYPKRTATQMIPK